jgi:hypothetical protein
MEGSIHGLVFIYYSGILLEGLREHAEILITIVSVPTEFEQGITQV